MGFFKDFKDDFSDAVNELVPEEGDSSTTDTEYVEPENLNDSLDEAIDVDDELSKLDGLFEQVSKKVENNESINATPIVSETKIEEATEEKKDTKAEKKSGIFDKKKSKKKEKESEDMDSFKTYVPEEHDNVTPSPSISSPAPTITPMASTGAASDENAVITKGMTINGSLESTGSINIEGSINGDITCNGKLVITGYVEGNSNSAEFFADAARVNGEVNTTGTAKIGVGSVVKGNIVATSAVIAGAVKGDIDVQGPVVVDTSAVVVGNIKSRSVQINNGAVIEGFCSQTYSDVDVEDVFGA